jgi:hypothetical protein
MSAMQAMMTKMLGDMLKNLPPDIQEKIDLIGKFVVKLDARLDAIDTRLAGIERDLGISYERRKLEHDGIQRNNGSADG